MRAGGPIVSGGRQAIIYRRRRTAADLVLGGGLLLFAAFVFFLVTELAFEKTGFTRLQFFAILAATLLGSYVDIPVWRMDNVRPMVVVREVRAFWVTYRIPQYSMSHVSTTIALNVGGGIAPSSFPRVSSTDIRASG
jgi:uncharacterized membrane protein